MRGWAQGNRPEDRSDGVITKNIEWGLLAGEPANPGSDLTYHANAVGIAGLPQGRANQLYPE